MNPNIVPGADDNLRTRILQEMVRLRIRKIDTPASVVSPTFSEPDTRRTGRPLNVAVLNFAATLMAEIDSISHKHATELLEINPDVCPGSCWAAAATAFADGARTNEDFRQWLREGLTAISHES